MEDKDSDNVSCGSRKEEHKYTASEAIKDTRNSEQLSHRKKVSRNQKLTWTWKFRNFWLGVSRQMDIVLRAIKLVTDKK